MTTGQDHLAALRDAIDDFAEGGELAAEWGTDLAGLLPHGRKLLACGNGGSAADSAHFTAEIAGRYDHDPEIVGRDLGIALDALRQRQLVAIDG
jgi:phosphoheptose isomerase